MGSHIWKRGPVGSAASGRHGALVEDVHPMEVGFVDL